MGLEGLDREVSLLRWAWEWVKIVATAVVVFLFVRAFVVEAFQIPTDSMESTLLAGDFLLVNKAVYGAELPGTDWRLPSFDTPEAGEVVIFQPPAPAGQPYEVRYVKRVVGGPGDTLAMRGGVLLRNGRRMREPYAWERDGLKDTFDPRFLWQRDYLVARDRDRGPYRPTRDDWGPLVVPPDSFFVLGDNRDDSEDSRYWGFVPRESIEGRPLFVYYSYDRDAPAAFPWLTHVRWDRFLEPVR